jgi:hypothetical protein
MIELKEMLLYNIVIELGLHMRLLRTNKICTKETYSKVCILNVILWML